MNTETSDHNDHLKKRKVKFAESMVSYAESDS